MSWRDGVLIQPDILDLSERYPCDIMKCLISPTSPDVGYVQAVVREGTNHPDRHQPTVDAPHAKVAPILAKRA